MCRRQLAHCAAVAEMLQQFAALAAPPVAAAVGAHPAARQLAAYNRRDGHGFLDCFGPTVELFDLGSGARKLDAGQVGQRRARTRNAQYGTPAHSMTRGSGARTSLVSHTATAAANSSPASTEPYSNTARRWPPGLASDCSSARRPVGPPG